MSELDRRYVHPCRAFYLAAALVGGLLPVEWAAAEPPPGGLFRDVTTAARITFRHQSAPEKKYIVESMGGGVALFDYDGDGLIDIYFVNSLTVDTATQPQTAPSALYRNLGDGRFVDVAAAAGVAHPGWGMGACVADVDGDGSQDLYVTSLGPNHLYRNRGDGTFADVTEAAGVAGGGWSTGCGFADYDRDGDLDLFVSRYVKIDLAALPEFGKGKTCQFRGVAVQCGPRGLPGSPDFFFRNDGGGHFTEVGKQIGVADPGGYYGLGVAWLDSDGDGWLDLFVANDAGPNFLYRNKHDGTFEETGFPAGVAVSEDGAEQGCMGVAVADYDHSGRQSLFITNFAEEYNVLYHNEGAYFTDLSFRSKTAPASLPYVGWGTAFLDYDNDGWPDVMVVNGHVYPQLDQAKLGASAPYRQRKLLYHNRGDGTFDEVAAAVAPLLMQDRVSRGLAVADFDGDGRLDVVINDLDGPPQLLHNDFAASGHWLEAKLLGGAADRDALGALVTVRAGSLAQTNLVRSGTSYISQDDMAQHFGLGAAVKADSLEVRWPDGARIRLHAVPAGKVVVVMAPPADAAARRR
ncbi:MAG TPA: CRTAC1 family protein [Thermoanaerobaculia bacterium]|nr:CRTAC1 family protein [Thermoanaerobaculia bacterium]